MASFKQWVDGHKSQVQRLVDTTSTQSRNRGGLLNRYLPRKNYVDWELLWLQVQSAPQIASFVAKGAEIPKVKKQFGIKELELGYTKLGLKHVWDEEAQERMARLKDMSNVRPALKTAIANMIYGDIQSLTRGVEDAAQLMGWQVIFNGACNIKDQRTGKEVKLSYDDKESALFPSALTGNDVFTDYANANGLQYLVDMSEAFYAINGFFPNQTVMSRKCLNHILAQDSTKKAAVSRQLGNPGAASDYNVTRRMFNELALDRDIPPIVLFDERYTDAKEVEQRFTPENKIAFLTNRGASDSDTAATEVTDSNREGGMGVIGFGPLVANSNRPGIYSFTEEESKEPPIDVQSATANVVPAIWRSSLLSAFEVF